MRHAYEIQERLEKWNKVKLSEFEQNALASIICELQWVLGADVDILRSNELWRAQEEALRKALDRKEGQ